MRSIRRPAPSSAPIRAIPTSRSAPRATFSVAASGLDNPALDAVLGDYGSPDCTSDCAAQENPIDPTDFSASAVTGPLDVSLSGGAAIIAVAGAVDVAVGSKSTANVGVSFVWNQVDATTTAEIANATVDASAVSVEAGDDTLILSIAVGIGGTGGKFEGVGSVTVNQIGDTSQALVGNSNASSETTSISAQSLSVDATDNSSI